MLVRQAFEFFDTDDSKAVSLSDFKSVMMEIGDPLSQEELELFFRMVRGISRFRS